MKVGKYNFWILLAMPFLAFASLMFFCLVHYGINTPYWDEWKMVPIFQKIDHNQSPIDDIWAQHNEHRIVFPNILMTLIAYITSWNIKAELLISLAFSLVTALMLYLFTLTKIKQKSLAVFAAILISAWFFSPVQYENWMWGWQIEWFMCVAAIMVSVFLLDRYCILRSAMAGHSSKLIFGGSMVSAVVATFSLGSGILVWPIGMFILLAYRKRAQLLVVWLVGFLLSSGAYYFNYHKPVDSPSYTVFLKQPMNFIRYVMNYFGRPVSDQSSVTTILGVTLILIAIPLIYMVWIKRAKISKFVPWVSLMGLALASGLITGISRLGFGLDQSLSGRYTAFSLLYIIGLIGLIFSLLDTVRLKTNTLAFIVLLALSINGPLLFASYTNGRSGFRQLSGSYKQVMECTHAQAVTRACLLTTYPSAKLVEPRLKYIKEKHWAGY